MLKLHIRHYGVLAGINYCFIKPLCQCIRFQPFFFFILNFGFAFASLRLSTYNTTGFSFCGLIFPRSLRHGRLHPVSTLSSPYSRLVGRGGWVNGTRTFHALPTWGRLYREELVQVYSVAQAFLTLNKFQPWLRSAQHTHVPTKWSCVQFCIGVELGSKWTSVFMSTEPNLDTRKWLKDSEATIAGLILTRSLTACLLAPHDHHAQRSAKGPYLLYINKQFKMIVVCLAAVLFPVCLLESKPLNPREIHIPIVVCE